MTPQLLSNVFVEQDIYSYIDNDYKVNSLVTCVCGAGDPQSMKQWENLEQEIHEDIDNDSTTP